MLRSVFLKGMRDQRRALLWWILGIAAFVALECAVYPTVRKSAGPLDEYLKSMPEALKNAFVGQQTDYASPAGFLSAEVFSFMAPILFLIYAIGAGARAIAGEEEGGTLDLLLAYPLSRRRLVLEKFAVLACGLAILTLALFASLVIGTAATGMNVGLLSLVQASALVGLLGLAFGAAAFVAAGAIGRRSTGIAVAAGLAAGSYLLNALALLVKGIESFRVFSTFYYYGGAEPLQRGLDPANLAVFGAAAAALLVATLVAFERRDVSV